MSDLLKKPRLAPPVHNEKGSDVWSQTTMRRSAAYLGGFRKLADAILAEVRAAKAKAERGRDEGLLGEVGYKKAIEQAQAKADTELQEIAKQAATNAEMVELGHRRYWSTHSYLARQPVAGGQSKSDLVALFRAADENAIAARAQMAVDDRDLGTLDALLIAHPSWTADVLHAMQGHFPVLDEMRAAAASAAINNSAVQDAALRVKRGDWAPPKAPKVLLGAIEEAGIRARYGDVTDEQIAEFSKPVDGTTGGHHDAAEKRLLAAQETLAEMLPLEGEPTGPARIASTMRSGS